MRARSPPGAGRVAEGAPPTGSGWRRRRRSRGRPPVARSSARAPERPHPAAPRARAQTERVPTWPRTGGTGVAQASSSARRCGRGSRCARGSSDCWRIAASGWGRAVPALAHRRRWRPVLVRLPGRSVLGFRRQPSQRRPCVLKPCRGSRWSNWARASCAGVARSASRTTWAPSSGTSSSSRARMPRASSQTPKRFWPTGSRTSKQSAASSNSTIGTRATPWTRQSSGASSRIWASVRGTRRSGTGCTPCSAAWARWR
mmetsp:Transcript_46520/g.144120  ORF Transcript_46520/g.144120 Transcript_46520/m.144120 type:complete len:258 (-) Transcript_46520:1471-2244(-)